MQHSPGKDRTQRCFLQIRGGAGSDGTASLLNAKLSGLYAEHYDYGYWAVYDEDERIACGDLEPSLEDDAKPTHSVDIVEQNGVGETQGQKEALGSGSFEHATVVSIEPDIIIGSEILADAAEPAVPLPKNSVDVVGPSTPPKNFVDVARPSAPPLESLS